MIPPNHIALFSNKEVLMQFDLKKIHQEYNNAQGFREAYKWIFGISTFGLGALYLWLTTVVIKEGEVGLRSNARGEMILLPPGRHSNLPWESYPCTPKSLANNNIQLNRYKIITVGTGEIAHTQNHGVLEVLGEGQHLITAPSHTFQAFVSTKQETKKLHQVVASTSDNVGLTLQADVRYQIKNPALALGCIHDIETSIAERAEMTIAQIVSSHTLSDFAPTATNVIATEAVHSQPNKGFGAIVSEIIQTLKSNLDQIGITLLSLGVTSWSINDADLAHQLAQGAVIQSQTASQMLTAERNANILKINSEAEAAAAKTHAEGEADAIKITGAAQQEVANTFRDNPIALQMYQASQAVQMVSHANNPHLFLTANGQQAPVLTAPIIHDQAPVANTL